MSGATRPSGYPGWASGPSGYILEPTDTVKALGWQPGAGATAGYFNWLHNLTFSWLRYLDQGQATQLLGDGSDGDLILGATLYQMSRHMYLNNLAIGLSGILDTNGYVPLIRGALTGISGVIRNSGQPGTTGNSYAMGLGGRVGTGPLVGGIGGGTGLYFSVSSSYGGQGFVNALGGNGASLIGGYGGATVLAPSGTWRKAPQCIDGVVSWFATGLGVTSAYLRGGGGGCAVPAIPDVGYGGGGGGGGVLMLPCQEVNFVGVLEAKGGAGGPAYTAGGGGGVGAYGGGGGGGGAVILSYVARTTLNARLDTSAGPGGIAGISGITGFPGFTGQTGVIEIRLGA